MSNASDEQPNLPPDLPPDLDEQVARKEARKMRARRRKTRGIWFGLGTFGVVGWSIAAPTVIGLLIGLWLDSAFPGRMSWTLALMLGGVGLGCLNAWRWVSMERNLIENDKQDAEAGANGANGANGAKADVHPNTVPPEMDGVDRKENTHD